MNALPWESLAGLRGEAERCTCSDDQLNLVGCDCAAQQNLPVRCNFQDCGQFLRTNEEIREQMCARCLAFGKAAGPKPQPGWFVPYEEGSGSVMARGKIGPFDSREKAEAETGRMIDRYPYWVPTGDPFEVKGNAE